MAAKPYRPKMTAAEKKAYKNRNFGVQGKTGGMGGKYGRKSENLTAKQLKASGALKAAKKRTVDISQTRREGAVTLGPGGKPLTGTVTLPNGKTAVYKGGKRVQRTIPVAKPKSGSGSSGGSGNKGTKANATLSAAQKAKLIRDKKLAAQMGAGGSGRTMSAAQANRLGTEGPKPGLRPGPVKYIGEKKYLSQWNIEKILAKNRATARKPSARTVPKRLGK